MGKVIFEHFRTLEELIDTVESRPYNKIWETGEKASQRTTDKSWYGTENYAESIELIKNGYKEPLERLKRELFKINKQTSVSKPKLTTNVVGFAPHIPNALQGIPTSMITRENRQEKTKTIHLMYGFSAIGDISGTDLIQGGTKFIGLVNSLELSGYRVKLDIVRCTTATPSDAIGFTVNLKQYTQNLNLLKLCYPLVHPSMLRRTSFKWGETLPNLEDGRYYGGHGSTLVVRMGWRQNRELAYQKEKEFLKKHGVIKEKNSYYCNVYEAMSAKNVNELAKKIGLVK
jgi:O-acetyl-ADP-ribose deacetylase (regulator of RNase III)